MLILSCSKVAFWDNIIADIAANIYSDYLRFYLNNKVIYERLGFFVLQSIRLLRTFAKALFYSPIS